MTRRPRRPLFALLTGVLAVGLCPARADEPDAVKEKLSKARMAYDAEVQKFKKAVEGSLDKREAAARTRGDKKALDQIKADRQAFAKWGEPPAALPAAIRQQAVTARSALDKAYATAVAAYTRMKRDAEAGEVEAERFQSLAASAFLVGKRTYLATLKHSDVKVAPGCPFRNDGTHPKTESKLTLGGEPVPHSLFTQPPPKGAATVSYALGGKFAALRATVGVPTIEEETDPKSPVTFEVLGDGKSLWKSEPVKARDVFQTCAIPVDKVKTLTLKVHCPDSNEYARAVWFEPVLAE